MKRNYLIIMIAILLVLAGGSLSVNFLNQGNFGRIERIIDGDTFVLESGERIRMLGIDTPERGMPFSQEASNWMKRFQGKVVKLENDIESVDKYDRLLMHVFHGNIHLNRELVEKGLAKTLFIEPNYMYFESIKGAEIKAREHRSGIWSLENEYCIGIYNFRYNAKGNDRKNLNGEYIIFRNSCNHSVSLDGWVVMDEKGRDFVFPDFSIEGKEKFSLMTGSGVNNNTHIFWQSKSPIWNNGGDRLVVLDKNGSVMLNYSY